ncbi:MAG TPA: ABC transporter substrate-binding protein [Vicinamibacterales bacterium]
MRAVSLTTAAVAIAAACLACGRHDASSGSNSVRLAIGGQNQMVYLPTTLAQELGYYKDEGLDVELQDFQGGAKALQALVGGSADVVSGFYDHTIQMAAEGRELVAFVNMLRFPGLVLTTSPQAAQTISKIEDFKGKMVGVTTAGSSSQMFLTFLLTRHGIKPEDVSVTAIGSAATAIAAVEHGKVDAGWLADPAFTFIKKRDPGVRVLADLRTESGVRDAFGTSTYPAAVLYASADYLRTHRDTAKGLAHAILRTLQWMHAHSAEEIAQKTPRSFRGDDEQLYVEALEGSMPMFSTDGAMNAEGAAAVRTLLSASMEKVRAATIDLNNTYTNELIR